MDLNCFAYKWVTVGHSKVAKNVHSVCWLTVPVICSHKNYDYCNVYKCFT